MVGAIGNGANCSSVVRDRVLCRALGATGRSGAPRAWTLHAGARGGGSVNAPVAPCSATTLPRVRFSPCPWARGSARCAMMGGTAVVRLPLVCRRRPCTGRPQRPGPGTSRAACAVSADVASAPRTTAARPAPAPSGLTPASMAARPGGAAEHRAGHVSGRHDARCCRWSHTTSTPGQRGCSGNMSLVQHLAASHDCSHQRALSVHATQKAVERSACGNSITVLSVHPEYGAITAPSVACGLHLGADALFGITGAVPGLPGSW